MGLDENMPEIVKHGIFKNYNCVRCMGLHTCENIEVYENSIINYIL
jgi:hypothetical protein